MVTHLLIGISQHAARRQMIYLGKDQMIEDFCNPAVVAVSKTLLAAFHDGVATSHKFHVAECALPRWVCIQIGWIAIEEPKVFDINRFGVVF